MNTKRFIRLMRHAGMILIALPEPFTTVLGVGLVVFSRYLSRRLEAGLTKRFRERLQHHLVILKKFRENPEAALQRKKRAPTGEERLLILIRPPGAEARFEPSSGLPGWQRAAAPVEESLVHHAIDMKKLARSYDLPPKSASVPTRMINHTLDRSRATGAEPKTSAEPKVVHHAFDIKTAMWRYGPAEAGAALKVR